MQKRPQNRLPKCLKPKKQTLSLKKQICFKKAYKFIWKKGPEAFSKMSEAKHRTVFQNAWSQKKTNTLIKKTMLFLKNIWIHMKKGHRTVCQNAWSQKKQTVSLKK